MGRVAWLAAVVAVACVVVAGCGGSARRTDAPTASSSPPSPSSAAAPITALGTLDASIAPLTDSSPADAGTSESVAPPPTIRDTTPITSAPSTLPPATAPATLPPTTSPLTTHGLPDAAQVSIAGFAFKPSSVHIAIGGTVTVTNTDATTHTWTADSGQADSWSSGALGQGGSFTHAFGSAGTFAYHCAVHPFMTGTVTVG